MEYNFSGLQKVEESKFNFEGLQPIEPIETTTSVRQPIRSMQPQPSEQRTEQSISLMESKPTKPLSESEPIPKPYERIDVPAATELSRLAPEGLAPEIEPERKGIRGGATRGWEPEGLYDRPEDFSTVSGAISQFSKNFLSSASAGLPEYVEGKMGVSEQPQGEMEEIAAGFGNLAGFIIGLPGRVTTAVAKQILKQYPRLITTGSEGVFKRIAKNLATEAPALGTGFAVSGLGRAAGEDNLEDALNVLSNEFKSGLGVGATFGVTRGVFPSSRIARIATGMALLDTLRGTSPWDERSLKQKVFDYGIDLWFLWKGGANPASIERAIRDRLHETFKEGKPLPKELLKVFKKRKWADELLILDELEKAITPSKVPSERTEMSLKDTLSEGVDTTPQLKAESGIKDIKPPSKPEAKAAQEEGETGYTIKHPEEPGLNFVEYMDAIGRPIDTSIGSPEEMAYYNERYTEYREITDTPIKRAASIEIIPGQTGLRDLTGEIVGTTVMQDKGTFGYASERTEIIVSEGIVTKSGKQKPAKVIIEYSDPSSPSGWLFRESKEFDTLEQAKEYAEGDIRIDLKIAAAEGKPVPPSVLKDYPDLAKPEVSPKAPVSPKVEKTPLIEEAKMAESAAWVKKRYDQVLKLVEKQENELKEYEDYNKKHYTNAPGEITAREGTAFTKAGLNEGDIKLKKRHLKPFKATLEDIVDAPTLFEMFPKLKKIKVVGTKNRRNLAVVTEATGDRESYIEFGVGKGRDPFTGREEVADFDYMQQSIRHEIAHLIGDEPGASPDAPVKQTRDILGKNKKTLFLFERLKNAPKAFRKEAQRLRNGEVLDDYSQYTTDSMIDSLSDVSTDKYGIKGVKAAKVFEDAASEIEGEILNLWNEAHKVEKGAKGKQKPIVPKKPKPQPKLEPKPTKPSKPSIPVEKVKTTEKSWKEVAVDAIKSGKDPVKEVIAFYKDSGFVGGQDTIRDMVNNLIKSKKKGKDVTLDMLGAQSVYEKTLGMMKDISTETNRLMSELKEPEYTRRGVMAALKAMINHDRNTRAVDFLHLQLKKVVNDIVPNKVRQMLMVHAYEHKMKGPEWDSLNEIERGVVRWAAKEKAKLDKYIDDNSILTRLDIKGLNHIYHHWINPKSGDPFTAFYGKFSKGLPQAIQRKIPDYRTGIAKGLKPATTNIGELIGLEWVAATRANNARQLMKVLHGIKGDPNGTIVLRGEPRPIRMVESWNKLDKQGLTDGYVRYDNPMFDKTIAFKDTNGNTVLMKGAVGVREEIFPFVQAYIESPNYGTFSQINFAVKSIKLGLSLFHVMSLGMQELANIRAPFVHIPAGLKLIRNLTPELKLLHQEGLEVKKGYEDLGYQNKFFDNATVLGKTGNIASTPIRLMRSFIFDIVQPGMKTSFADYQLRKMLPEYLKKAGEKMTAEEVMARYADGKSIPEAALKCARDVVKKSDGHFSGEHYKRALLETNRFMVKMYFSPQARVIWQGLLLSPTWQREHILVAKNVIKSFMPDSMIKKIDKMSPSGFEEIGPIKSQYRRYALGGIMILGAVDLWNQIATQEMDGKAKHLWENPKGKRFAVRAWWNEPDYTVVGKTGRTRNIKGGAAYIRPIKSLFEVAEWFSDPFEKFSFKVAPLLTATINQFFPSIDKYDGWEIKERLKDLGIDILAPIVVDQMIMAAENKKEWWGALTSSIGAPSSKEKRPPGPKPPFKSPFKGNKGPFGR